MPTKFTCFILLNLFIAEVSAQIKTVNYDILTNEINGDTPLPSEDVFFIKGVLPEGIELVEVGVKKGERKNNVQELYAWKKPFDFDVSQFELFISDPLRSNEYYFFEFSFFKRADQTQIQNVQNFINSTLESYLRANLEVSSKGIKVNQSNQVIIAQMNQIVIDALEDFRHSLGKNFKGFSDIFRQKLEQKDRLKLKRAKLNIKKKNKDDNDKVVYANQYIDELIAQAEGEVGQFVDKNLLALVDVSSIKNYPTEKKSNTLPLNIGYGSIPFKRSLPETEFLSGPFAGVSLPLGNKTFTKFLGNTSFSAGVFLQNFESERGDKISGQFIGLPIYTGLGYKCFRFMRLTAGAVALNQKDVNTGMNSTHLQFFAGLSLEFNLWVGLSNKK